MAKWISKAIKHPGALRKTLRTKKGKKISTKKLNKATKSKNTTLRKRAFLAKTLRKLARKRKRKK
jgi:hypothetical protein